MHCGWRSRRQVVNSVEEAVSPLVLTCHILYLCHRLACARHGRRGAGNVAASRQSTVASRPCVCTRPCGVEAVIAARGSARHRAASVPAASMPSFTFPRMLLIRCRAHLMSVRTSCLLTSKVNLGGTRWTVLGCRYSARCSRSRTRVCLTLEVGLVECHGHLLCASTHYTLY